MAIRNFSVVLVLSGAAVLMYLLAGCSTTRVMERVTVDTIRVASPVVEDSLRAVLVSDTVIVTNRVVERDTVIDVRYYPKLEKFYIKVKPDTVTIFKVDTVETTIEREAEDKEAGDGKILLITVVTIIIIMIYIKFRR